MNELVKLALQVMTPIQGRRYILYLRGRSLVQIAKKEGVSVEVVRKTIKRGRELARKWNDFKKQTN